MKRRLPAFDVLVDMARNNPQKLEVLRHNLTQSVIAGASTDQQRKRLEGLQFRVDMERERAGSNMEAAIRISELMCYSLADLHRSLVISDKTDDADPAAPNATVINFPSPAKIYVEYEDQITDFE